LQGKRVNATIITLILEFFGEPLVERGQASPQRVGRAYDDDFSFHAILQKYGIELKPKAAFLPPDRFGLAMLSGNISLFQSKFFFNEVKISSRSIAGNQFGYKSGQEQLAAYDHDG